LSQEKPRTLTKTGRATLADDCELKTMTLGRRGDRGWTDAGVFISRGGKGVTQEGIEMNFPQTHLGEQA
jgi:hypothetical protein